MKPRLSVVVFTTILLLIQLANVQRIGTRQPQAPTVTAAQIQAWRANSKISGQLLIVDVRDEAETDVSIIPGAIALAEFEKTQQNQLGKTVITYCTVGYRSAIYAHKLREEGWNAWNYQGSILDWCDHRLPVVTPSGQNTKRVHTYSSRYALAAGYQAVY